MAEIKRILKLAKDETDLSERKMVEIIGCERMGMWKRAIKCRFIYD